MGYLAGRGIADITGEIAECGLLGYGLPEQQAAGLHTRLRARAFALADGERRMLLVICDLPLVFSSVTQAVLRRLPAVYTEANVVISATHTHCGPGGYSHHAVYNGTTGGFRPQTFRAIVDGIVEAARRAIADLRPATLRLNRGELHDASVNRSRRAFERNPSADKAAFPDAVDPATTLLTIERDGLPVALIDWFAVHNTSMTNRNRLVSADNKGYAAYHWEREVSGFDYLAEDAEPALVTAFAQTNAGDMSPNLNLRPGSGPTEDEFENTRIIGTRQYEAAAKLLAGRENAEVLDGGLDHRLVHVDMADVRVSPRFSGDGLPHRTSHAVPGATAFAGALPDGPTGWRFVHPEINPFLDTVSRDGIYRLARRLRETQAPKTLAAPISLLNRIVPFGQEILPIQLLRIGSLYLLCLPFEVTIVAGLRLRRTVAEASGTDPDHVIVMGYANAYGHYVTTPEEYDAQMYEGASTLFGRWQLPALQQNAARLATAMREGRQIAPGRAAPDLSARHRRQPTPPRADGRPPTVDIGEELSFAWDEKTLAVEFAAVHPFHDPRRGGTYYEIQRREGLYWHRIADDGDWSTRMRWTRLPSPHDTTLSKVRIEWRVPPETPRGRYRLVYRGDTGQVAFEARSREFDLGAGEEL
ncbi:Neutral/alkaline nonlysosomal ceramidase [Catenulispora acidiphila DSM 44928]|uniref:Neutral ceramidase n=1 Tax=Catenulispora acidiphila (strain DSM 44928 / JCM 14897 / NBRC 102108 / NRRL B-24433 / ID139908) TaxID=479433 RepID=C7PZ53_CATAD|nr:neutral/alkaline non-lysosomal ceramidase N-terminal domain-containing protein [Catenulispora acidiphila]ACU69609.1 Neutral/alkaline nonlysosomal ceramidase [Catenulispora acidiphila DSM 44928]